MDRRDCSMFQGGMRIQRDDNVHGIDKPKPGVVVRCGPLTGKTYITDPVVVVEVLSPSTIDIDRGRKLGFYKSLDSLQHIALVYVDQMRVEHYRRVGDGWDLQVVKQQAEQLEFAAVEFGLPLQSVYFHAEPV